MEQIKLFDLLPIKNIELDRLSFGQRIFCNRSIPKGTRLYDLKYNDYCGQSFTVEYNAPYDCYYVPNTNCRNHTKWYQWDHTAVEPILCELWKSMEEYDLVKMSNQQVGISSPLYGYSNANVLPDIHQSEHEQINDIEEHICYTYLMRDESTGYYKIGMSNKPEYRERTLQAEKPTITLVSTHAHRNRQDARNQEKFLHQKYAQERVRGEWFCLSQKDEQDIKKLFQHSRL